MLAPGHFHAALIQKQKLPGIDAHTHVFAPFDSDLTAHLARVVGFNTRTEQPTDWTVDVHAGDDWPERFLRDRPGNVAILSGRNRQKIDLMRLAIEAGMHVLADKPWIIDIADLPRLHETLGRAAGAGLVVHDIMTERFEITSILQKRLVDDLELFGIIENGDHDNPGVFMESVHYLKKTVAGTPLRRPGWFFDITQQGEALSDVGTHLVDQVLWMLFTDEPINRAADIRMEDARRWPTVLDREQFEAITGLPDFPADLESWITDGKLEYFCNNQVIFSLRDISVRLDVLWEVEAAPGGGDTHNAVFRGTRCSAIIRQAGGKPPELFVIPNPGQQQKVRDLLNRRIEEWQTDYPGLRLVAIGAEFHVMIPDAYRTSHEAHFAEVTAEFLRYVRDPSLVPAWELPNLLAKYFVTTQGVAEAHLERLEG